MTRLRHYDHLGTARFVTFGCYRRLPLLTHDAPCRAFVRRLQEMREKWRIRIFGWVIMPDHVHLVLFPPDIVKLGGVIGELKLYSSRDILSIVESEFPALVLRLQVVRDGLLKRAVWNRRCYDHNCRDRAAVIEKINYCHHNPVKRGLVSEPGEWEWSSYRWYAGNRDVPIELDDLGGPFPP